MEEQPTAVLHNWKSYVTNGGIVIYCGNIFDDTKKRFTNGKYVYTSRVTNYDKNHKEGDTIKTLNSSYRLGKRSNFNQ